MSRYGARVLHNGRTVKSGLSMEPRERQRLTSGLYRAVVLRTRAVDDSERLEEHPHAIECDVLLMKSLVELRHVRVVQQSHGVHDGSLWVPRPSTRALSGGALSLNARSARGALEPFPTALDDLDGDVVLVQFVEHDSEYPLITGALPHSKTKRLVVKGSGWNPALLGTDRGKPNLSEHYFRYRGVEVRINDRGDVLLDTQGAYDRLGDILEVPGPVGGQVRLRLKGTEKFVIEVNGQDAMEFSVAGIVALLKVAGAVEALGEVSAMNIGGPLTAVHLSTHLTPSPFGPLGPPLPG